MKKLGTLLSLSAFVVNVYAVNYEYPYIFKDPRTIGMGGATIAIGGYPNSIFYNPAGISNIPLSEGFLVNLLSANISINKNSIDFIKDFMDALDTPDRDNDGDDGDDKLQAVNDVLLKYRGKNVHFYGSNYSSISRRFIDFAFSGGVFISVKSDSKTHQGFGSEGILEIDYSSMLGGIFGISYNLLGGALSLGLSGKYIYKNALVHSFTARELVEHEDNLDTYITDELAVSETTVGFDFGAIYRLEGIFPKGKFLRPSIGFSLLNIGDLDFGEAGKIPMTLNIGFALNPDIPFFNNWVIGFDFIDILKNYEQDEDNLKRIRFGTELKLFDNKFTDLSVRAGIYQGYPTAGIDFRLLILRVGFTTYAEEVGAYSGQDVDRRYIATAEITW